MGIEEKNNRRTDEGECRGQIFMMSEEANTAL